MTSRKSYENKIQEYPAVIISQFFSNWIYFLEIDRVLDHVTRTNHVTRSRVSCWDHPGKSDTWSKWKYQIFDLTLIVIVAKGTNPKSKCSTITVTSSCLILATNDSAGVISLKTDLNWDRLETGSKRVYLRVERD